MTGTTPWRVLSHDFEVTDAGVDVEFVCDFYRMAGEVWFDLDTLRVRDMSKPTATPGKDAEDLHFFTLKGISWGFDLPRNVHYDRTLTFAISSF